MIEQIYMDMGYSPVYDGGVWKYFVPGEAKLKFIPKADREKAEKEIGVAEIKQACKDWITSVFSDSDQANGSRRALRLEFQISERRSKQMAVDDEMNEINKIIAADDWINAVLAECESKKVACRAGEDYDINDWPEKP